MDRAGRATAVIIFACLAVLSPVSADVCEATKNENQLLREIRAQFQKKNARISEVSVLEIAPFRRPGPPEKYVLVAWGIVSRDAGFSGNFWDEVFGFFVADDKLTTIEETLGIVPTPRWRDYSFTIDGLTYDTVTVRGAGDTYGDQPQLLQFKWNPFKAKRRK